MAGLAARMGDPEDRADLLLAEVDTLTPWTDASMTATQTRIAAARISPARLHHRSLPPPRSSESH